MGSKIRFVSVIGALALVLAAFGPLAAAADGGAATYRYLLAAGFVPEVGADLCALGAPGETVCPALATADNGHRIELAGEGMLSTHPKSANGGGTFTHRDAAGNVVATGTWTATELLSFHSYGSAAAQGLPAKWEGGKAALRVHLSVNGTPVAQGVLEVICELGDPIPASAFDGATLNVQGLLNFNKPALRFTLFIRQ